MSSGFASWLLLGLALLTAVTTFCALIEGRHLGWGNLAWFLCGWLTSELPSFQLLLTWSVTAVLVAFGALDAWPGTAGLFLLVVSSCGLLLVQSRSANVAQRLEQALAYGLGSDYRESVPVARRFVGDDPVPMTELLRPFALRGEGVQWHRDLRYGDEHPRQLLDVYVASAGAHDAPVLLQIHGGGWTMGDKREQALPLIYYLALRGWIVVAPNYGLAPASRFPQPLLDCRRALGWIRRGIREYGGNPDFVAVTGGSAGGHLATLLALTSDRDDLPGGLHGTDLTVSACVPLYGVYDFLDRDGLRRDGGAMTRWLADKVMPCPPGADHALWDLASPLAQVHAAAPPFFVLHGSHDSLSKVEEARCFVERLRAVSRSPVAFAELPGAQHAWDMFRTPRALHTVRAVARFLEWTHAAHAAGRHLT
jgi:acetyl esterase/lipase